MSSDDFNHFHFPATPEPDPDLDRGIPIPSDAEGRLPDYPDTGCSFSPSCLSCALPQCVLDMKPSQVAQLRRALRRGNRPLTATETAVEALVDKGVTLGDAVSQVAAQESVTEDAIRMRLARHSATPVRTGKKMADQEMVRTLQDLLATGMTRSAAVRQLASAQGVSTTTINKRMRAAAKSGP